MTRDVLDDERAFLLDSLEDLERERAAGDLVRAGLRGPARPLHPAPRRGAARPGARILFRVRSVDRGVDTGVGGGIDTPGSAAGAARLLVVGLLAVAAAVAVVVVVTQTGARLPGQTATGSVSLSRGAQERRTLAQAQSLEASGDAAGALGLYGQVLAEDPTQPEALAESGWLEFEAGVQSKDAAVLARRPGPGTDGGTTPSPAPTRPICTWDRCSWPRANAAGAVAQYRRFLADGPPPSEVEAAQPFIDQAFQKAGQPVPASAGPTPTTTSSPAR